MADKLTTLVVPRPHADVGALAGLLTGAVILALAVLQLGDVSVDWQGRGDHVVTNIPEHTVEMSMISLEDDNLHIS